MSLEDTVRQYSLQNAIKFDGKAQPKAVLGKIMAEYPQLNAREALQLIQEIIEDVNALSLDDQRRELEEKAPELLEKKVGEKKSLPDLPNARMGSVITRFPPEPNGYLHIGHAKAAFVDYEYAQKYKGCFILRFDDTNPLNESLEFYETQKEDLKWLGIEWDQEYRTSDHLPQHYELAEKLIKDNHAYVCTCPEEKIRETRKKGVNCPCRKKSTFSDWKNFFTMGEGEAIVRLKADMSSVNTAMRDPTLFRIIDHPHPIHGTKYRAWPTYDFCGAVEDSISGVTHPFRTKEYELRDEVYFFLLDCLGLRKPHLMEFARLSIVGMPVSKRKIKPLIDQKLVMGWDDPRLPTLKGLQRRGILSEAIREFVLSQGLSKAESSVTFDQVEAHNRKILDPVTQRFFFVPNPVQLEVSKAPKGVISIKNHPSSNLGIRKIQTSSTFFIPQTDADDLKTGEIFRLKDLFNVTLTEKKNILYGEFTGGKVIPSTKKIQWVTNNHIPLSILKPSALFINDVFQPQSLEKIRGYAEKALSYVSNKAIVQCERFGFIKIEKTGAGMKGIFIHK
jgi:glutamyl-tRNA synthetase